LKNYKLYGKPPYKIILIHGGPGAAGEMSPVAQELSEEFGVIEAFQTKFTIDDLVKELSQIINEFGDKPVTLVGHSWGAWLAYIYTARIPSKVQKLFLVDAGSFEEKYTTDLTIKRMKRLSEKEKVEVFELSYRLSDTTESTKEEIFKRLGELMIKTDSYNLLVEENGNIVYRYDIYEAIWPEASEMRRNGKLLDFGKNMICPVIAIHGMYDSHPVEGVVEPLSRIIKDFKFFKLEKCGHYPWRERYAREKFYEILVQELTY